MAYCKKFINGINAINFSSESAVLLRDSLIAAASQELKTEYEVIQKELSELPDSIPDNEFANIQLELYRQKQKQTALQIESQLKAFTIQYGKKIVEAEAVIGDADLFVKTFAENFRDINHLAYTLSDAPPVIKELQTALYIEVLFKLEPAQQEVQLQTLLLPNIKDMVEKAIAMYDSNPKNAALRNQCQRLVHMGLYEIARRDCNTVEKVAASPQYKKYQEFIAALVSKLPPVGQSSVIDGFSNYKATNGTSIGDLLAGVEDKYKIMRSGGWENDDKINALKARKTLFNALRFGQEDRREYAKKTESNLARDLFWAKNIEEVELFTKSKISEKTASSLTEQNYLAQEDRPFKEKLKKYTDEQPEYRKLQEVLERMYDKENREEKGIPIGKGVFSTKEAEIKDYIRKTLIEEMAQPQVTVLPNGEIEMNLYFFKMDENFVNRLFNIIRDRGGFGWGVSSIMSAFTADTGITEKLHCTQITGNSLSDIETQLTDLERTGRLPVEQTKAYKAEFNNLKKTINLAQYSKLSQLQPDNNSEQLVLGILKELQELYAVKRVKDALTAPTALSLKNALAEINRLASSKSKGSHELLLEKINQLQSIYANKSVKDTIPTPRAAFEEMKRLALGKKTEELLRRIQELQVIYGEKRVYAPTASILEAAFGHLDAGRPEEALNTLGLLSSLKDASQRLSKVEREISFLKLDNNQELLLRKLLELQFVSTDKSVIEALNAPTALSLEEALAKIKELALSKSENSHELLLKIKELQSIYADKIVKDTIPTPKNAFEEINQLALAKNNESLLSRIEELQVVYAGKKVHAPTASILNVAFDHLVAGGYKDALDTPGLEKSITDAYTRLSGLNVDLTAEQIKPVIKKSKVIATSSQEREKKSKELEAAFESGVDVTKKVEAIFLEEYRAMKDTLKLTGKEVERMEAEIKGMAEEMVCLIERTSAGQPAITEAEQDAYFSILQQIAKAIDQDLSEVRFKVKHSVTGKQTVNVLDAEGKLVKAVEIDLGNIKLPYSLIKPPGGDFIFSYGGTRGIIAPFEGLDKAYAGESGKKGRLFTHSRLLGVGQYGSVKEVESLLSGLNQVIKKGYVPTADDTSTFKDESRNDLRTRPVTARDDPLYRIESDVLQNLSKAESVRKGSGAVSGGTQYWIEKDKSREAGVLFSKSGTPQQYQILTERAKGDTFADTANKKLNLFAKPDIAYHDPLKRDPRIEGELIGSLKDTLDLSQAIVGEAQKFQALHFSHNDIKPENFLYKKNSDGSYQIKFIDWATGGFVQYYNGSGATAAAIFAEVFEGALPTTIKENECSDAQGRFVRIDGPKKSFGVDPTLQILHGARNGTLPYISPKVLGEDRSHRPKDGSVPDPTMNTVLTTDESYMDDWALTAMTFGVCNRQAYFTLVKGRAVTDYVIPGVLDGDGGKPLGLKISSRENFNKFFACGSDTISEEDLRTGAAYTKQDAVMFIPSNQREGEPLHLYRRLQMVQEKLQATEGAKVQDSSEQKIVKDIEAILTEVHKVVASGTGFTKTQLQEQLAATQQCIKNYEKLNEQGYKAVLLKGETLQSVFLEHEEKNFTADNLLTFEGELRRIEILSTYPRTEQQKEKAIAILNEAINEAQFNDKFIGVGKPCRHLFRECIKEGQGEILSSLLAKISPNKAFIDLVHEQGLLHYAAEQGMSDVFSNLIKALKVAGATDKQIFELMLVQYGPGEKHIKTAPQVKWATNCFHIAIRNNSPEQLTAILALLPGNTNIYDDLIKEALHLCAVLGKKELFNQIFTKFNDVNGFFRAMKPETVLNMIYPPDDTSPYHLFLNDKATLDAIPWAKLKGTPSAAKTFLLTPPPGTHSHPVLIAAKNGNYAGVSALFDLGTAVQLSAVGWAELFGQTDEKGKNLFNYVLEQGQLTTLTGLLSEIKKNCTAPQTVLVHLLSNPHPVNPLRNFLNSEKNEAQKFKILNQLFNEISPDFKSEEAQKARIVALLVNETWLIEKANNPKSHDALRELLQNDKLSTSLKQGLFAKLAKDAEEPSLAKTFYNKLLAEVSPHQEAEMAKSVALEIPVGVMQEVARQSSDLNVLINALASGRDVVKELNEQIIGLKSTLAEDADKHKKILEVQKDIAEEALQKARLQFTSELDKLAQDLSEKTKALKEGVEDKEQLGVEIRQLKEQLVTLEKDSSGKIRGLEEDAVLKAQEYKEELESQKHAADELLKKTRQGFTSELDKLTQALSEKTNALYEDKEQLDLEIGQLKEQLLALEKSSGLKISGLEQDALLKAQEYKNELESQKRAADELLQQTRLELTSQIDKLAQDLSEKTSALEKGAVNKEQLDLEIGQLKEQLLTLEKSSGLKISGLEQDALLKAQEYKNELESQKRAADELLQQTRLELTSQIDKLAQDLSEKTKALKEGVEDKEQLGVEIRQLKEQLVTLEKSSGLKISGLEQDALLKAQEYKNELESQNRAAKKLEEIIQSKDKELQQKHEQLERLAKTLKLVGQQKAVLVLEKVIANSGIDALRVIAEAESPEDLLDLGLDQFDVEVLKETPLMFVQAKKEAGERLWRLEHPQQKVEAEELSLEVFHEPLHQNTKKKPLEQSDVELFMDEDALDELPLEDRKKGVVVEEDEFFEEDESIKPLSPHGLPRRTSLKPVSGSADPDQQEAFDALVAEIDQSRDYELLQLISRARTKEDLFKKTEFGRLNSQNVHALLDHPYEIGKIVERARVRLARLDDFRNGEKHNILDSRSKWQALERFNREGLQGAMEKIAPLQEIRKELKYLGETPMTWVNPVFQDSAKREAMKLDPHLQDLADGVDVIVPYLYKQRCTIKEFLSGLPSDRDLNWTPYQDEVIAYKKVLTRYLHRIEDELRIHMPIQKLLKGDEDKKNLLEQQGMLQTLKQAKEELKDMRQLSSIFTVSYTDYPIAEKNNHLDSSRKTGLGASLEVYEPDNPHSYQMVDRVKPDHFREHTVAVNNLVVGRFIEERVAAIDKIGVKPKVKLTVTSFPPATDVDGRVAFSMAIVTQLLAGLKDPPSAKNPIILSGENTEQLEYLWTALRIIGDKSPHMKFGPETIKVASSQHFNPAKEMGQGTEKFSADSCYKKNFENCPQLNQLVTEVAKLTSDKFGHTEKQQKVHAHSGQAVTVFKGKMKEALEEMRQDNNEERGHELK